MNHPSRFLRSCLTALLLSLPAADLAAQASEEEDGPRWYQVEMIIFSRRANSAEQWPSNIQLRYPFEWVELRNDSEGAEDIPSWDRGLSALKQSRLEEQAFVRLPQEQRSMDRYADAMDRDGKYRVLFHEAWRQPMVELDNSPAILIRGGDQYEDHYELEGSVTLSVSRYLHLHTRLWLTEFEPNFGQPPGAWPELPHRPELPLPAGETPQPNWMADDNEWSTDWSAEEDTWNTGLSTASGSGTPDFLGDDYLPGRIATLTQQRRMRSEELHYIDHPLMGLLVRITPYEFPDDSEDTGN